MDNISETSQNNLTNKPQALNKDLVEGLCNSIISMASELPEAMNMSGDLYDLEEQESYTIDEINDALDGLHQTLSVFRDRLDGDIFGNTATCVLFDTVSVFSFTARTLTFMDNYINAVDNVKLSDVIDEIDITLKKIVEYILDIDDYFNSTDGAAAEAFAIYKNKDNYKRYQEMIDMLREDDMLEWLQTEPTEYKKTYEDHYGYIEIHDDDDDDELEALEFNGK